MLMTLGINIVLVIACILIHFTFMSLVASRIERMGVMRELHLLLHVFSGLSAHLMQIFLFAAGIYFMIDNPELGTLAGDYDGSFSDAVYFSMTTYSSLGYGDIEPEGWIRFTAGIETLVGLMMITWTASLLYLSMERTWKQNDRRAHRVIGRNDARGHK
ncbi:Uncharacterised protein [BD1-7 clade bacterium]|uniref:Potassium channel domain-containing protein n=1 Tax=BD1-7 clade bacterium TaxID=2029982 RepID=A0A5S9MU68_9GAMM|nr:Uncharacterised protein [BD1-7 clade bacterium]CAA0084424.1 Uncharacterised protein [BD1-7 clade bacterium]